MNGVISMGDGLVYRSPCKLIFDEFSVIVRWPAPEHYEENIPYSAIQSIYYSRFFSRLKIIYTKDNKEKSIVFETGLLGCKKELMSDRVRKKLKQYSIDTIEYSRRNKSYSKISQALHFWVFYYSQ